MTLIRNRSGYSGDYLFLTYDMHSVMKNRQEQLFDEVDKLNGDDLLNRSEDDLITFFNDKYNLQFVELCEDDIVIEQNEMDIDVSQDRQRSISDRSRPFYLKGIQVKFLVPFAGDPELFKCKPTQVYPTNPPKANISDGNLTFKYSGLKFEPNNLKRQFQNELSQVKSYLSYLRNDVDNFNSSLSQIISERIEFRKKKILKDKNLVESLGYPIRRRNNAPKTFRTPEVRRKIIPKLPPIRKETFKPEPELDMAEYDHILEVVQNMALVMERSPKAFNEMDEEDLRQHFLVQLNGQYEGQATGETINYEGKTDILIRSEGKNIFIAECKFWKGQKAHIDTIDQLLGYASWRDTKTAIVVFNRNKDFSSVILKIKEITQQHPNCKKQLSYASETGFRFKFHHKDDVNREILITILAFNVPN